MKIDYKMKSLIFSFEDDCGLLTLYNKYRRYRYCIDNGYSYVPKRNDYDGETLCALYHKYFDGNEELLDECEKILNSNRARSYRLRCKITWMLAYCPSVTFCTLTFNDNYFAVSSAATRRQTVSRFLSSLEAPYIANVDYGDLGSREHYHAVVGCRVPKDKLLLFNGHFGNIDVKKVRFIRLSCVRLSKYISKLANHAVKVSACRNALLFSRKYPIPSGKELSELLRSAVALDLVRATSCVSSKHKYKVTKVIFNSNRMFIKYCQCCGQLITDYYSNLHNYELSRLKNGKTVTQYFCKECIETYKIKR